MFPDGILYIHLCRGIFLLTDNLRDGGDMMVPSLHTIRSNEGACSGSMDHTSLPSRSTMGRRIHHSILRSTMGHSTKGRTSLRDTMGCSNCCSAMGDAICCNASCNIRRSSNIDCSICNGLRTIRR